MIQIYPPASTNRAHTSIHPLPLLLVSFFVSSPSTNLALVMHLLLHVFINLQKKCRII